jgi:hypothetical protein
MVSVALGLIALQVIVTSPINDLIPAMSYLTGLAAKWIDPTVPLIPATSSAGSTSSTRSTSSADSAGQRLAGIGRITTGFLSVT